MSGFGWVTTPSWLSISLSFFFFFFYRSSVYSCHDFISSVSFRPLPFLPFIVPLVGWNVPLIFLVFLKRSLVFTLLLLFSISLHCSLKKTFYSGLTVLGTLHLVECTFPFLPCFSLLFYPQLFVKPPQQPLRLLVSLFLHTVFTASIHSSSRILFTRSNPLNLFVTFTVYSWTSLVAQIVKASAYNVGDPGSIPGLGGSPGEGNGNLLQYSCLENPMDGGSG